MFEQSKYKVLSQIEYPDDLKKLDITLLKDLCEDIRQYLIDVVSVTGGHFGGGLGAVELAVALHRIYNTPTDKIVWDTGHQAYPHKILTGRKQQLPTIRQLNGLSGFLKRSESEYDAFGAGHASTSISAALGMAIANKIEGNSDKVVAVIGDGAMTGGMAYEAMNNAGLLRANLVVVLNDNNMSIAENVWQFSRYFTGLITNPEYNKFKGMVWDVTGKLDSFGDRIRKLASRVEGGLKGIFTPGMLFEALGFRYFGPLNGHNVQQLVRIFKQTYRFNEPILIHILTEKGKGYKPAEMHKQKLHASSPFDKITGKSIKKASGNPSYTEVFGKTLVDIVRDDKKVVGISAAMPDGTGLDKLKEAFPKNFIDVGIAEEHAVTFAAGLATKGIVPVVAIYSTFMQRAIDQIVHDVALQKLHVVFALDRAGLVGADGPTHHGSFDLTYLRFIPGMVIMSPKDEAELQDMLYTAVKTKAPIAIRYPRGAAEGAELKREFELIPIGKAETIKEGKDVALLAVGNMVGYAKKASKMLEEEHINAEIINMRFVKPLDTELLKSVCKRFDKLVTLEENSIVGGMGSAVAEFLTGNNLKNDLLMIGLPDDFVEHGTQKELHHLLKIDPEGITDKVKSFYKPQNQLNRIYAS